MVTRTFHEEVGHAQAYNGDHEIQDGPSERDVTLDLPESLIVVAEQGCRLRSSSLYLSLHAQKSELDAP